MNRQVVAMLTAAAALAGTAIGAASGGASATLPPEDTVGTDLIRDQAEAAATEFLTADDPTVSNVACVGPTADSSGVEMLCYGTNGAGDVVTAIATINDYGEIEMSGGGAGPTPTEPPGATTLATFSGSGSSTQPVDAITAPTIVRVTHVGDGEFSVQPQHGGVAAGDVLLTVTGPTDGRYLVGLGGTISGFAIVADGTWTLELQPIASAVPLAPGTPSSGDTSDVVAYTGSGAATIEYTGTGPILVRALTSAGPSVLVDEPGAFTGEVTLPAGPGNLQVEATGHWTITLPGPPPTTAAPTTPAPTTATPTTVASTAVPAPTTAGPTTSAPGG